jgi:hypothetical protein
MLIQQLVPVELGTCFVGFISSSNFDELYQPC